MTWVRKKYTKTFSLESPAGADRAAVTVSIIGGKNNQDPNSTCTLFNVDQDTQLKTDMGLYQFFRIRGCAIKTFFPMPTT